MVYMYMYLSYTNLSFLIMDVNEMASGLQAQLGCGRLEMLLSDKFITRILKHLRPSTWCFWTTGLQAYQTQHKTT